MNGAKRVEVFADPGLCSRTVEQVITDLDFEDHREDYELIQVDRMIPLRPDTSLDLEAVRGWSRAGNEDAVVIVTEIPRRAGRRPKLTAVHFEDRVVIISLPALGVTGLKRKLYEAIFGSLNAIADYYRGEDVSHSFGFGTVYQQESPTGPSVYVTSPWWLPGRPRLIAGMIRTNEPLKDVTRLKGMWAAAAGTGAFGIFYSSIWQMAHALPAWRLGVISVAAIALMVTWLIFSNKLWEHSGKLNSKVEAVIYNVSTVATLLVAVVLLYAALYLGVLIMGAVVIEQQFMSEIMGMPVDFRNYLEIAWLAASMGIMAGAVGSNFDSSADVQNLTHGQREAQRTPSDKD